MSRSNIIHKHKYDYSLVVYKNIQTPVIIICPDHGQFVQRPDKHLIGRGCKLCGNQTSKAATEWLLSLNIDELRLEYRLPEKPLRVVDAYDPATHTVYQFHGDLWHGNPAIYSSDEINPVTKETFGDAYARTLRLDDEIKALGYNLVIQWENGKRKDITKRAS